MKKLFFTILIFLTFFGYSQKEIVTFKMLEKKSNAFIKDATAIVNKNDISILLMDDHFIYSSLLDEKFTVKNKQIIENNNYTYFLDNYTNNQTYKVILTNNNFNKFAVLTNRNNVDFKIEEVNINLKDEDFMFCTVLRNKFYLTTITKDTSVLNFYILDEENKLQKKLVDLSSEKFIDPNDKRINLHKLLRVNKEYTNYSIKRVMPIIIRKSFKNIIKINQKIPSHLTSSIEFSKVYFNDNNCIITLDQNKKSTQTIHIDLNSLNFKVIRFEKPLQEIKAKKKRSNSFIKEDNIYLISSFKEKFILLIKNIYSGALIKEFHVSSNSNIAFKNTPIIAKEFGRKKIWNYNKTKKLINPMSFGYIGVTVFKYNEEYILGIGALVENDNSNTRIVYIKSKFDKKFNHLTGKIIENVFNKADTFKENETTLGNSAVFFKYHDYYILGKYLSWPKKEYRLRKFKD